MVWGQLAMGRQGCLGALSALCNYTKAPAVRLFLFLASAAAT